MENATVVAIDNTKMCEWSFYGQQVCLASCYHVTLIDAQGSAACEPALGSLLINGALQKCQDHIWTPMTSAKTAEGCC